MSTLAMKTKLSPEQVAQFHREGYLMVEDVFTDADLQPVIDEVSEEIDIRAREMVASDELSQTYEDQDFEHRLAKISAETDKVALSIWNGQLSGPAFFGLITNPSLLDVAEQICGEELIASSVYRLRPKIPGHRNSAVPWHQDSGYFEPYCDTALVLTVWLPLVNADATNGCMWVLPRTHLGEVVPHIQANGKPYLEIPDTHLPEGEPLCVPVKKGGVLLMTNKTAHASFENSTDRVRWSMDLRYQSAALPTNANITRLPGESVPSPEAGVPIACYPPEADFLVRSKARPEEILTSAAEFHRLRNEHLAQPMTNRFSASWA
ncbi:phytanoyl-CoA dioxygenase family protein [Capsulimonas sp.]|uniref:phytanoyl-CoA dioxygenase family protein n=2 Tax=Capsulimonas sp. TaxID=2494211 RepID=UPI003264E2BB